MDGQVYSPGYSPDSEPIKSPSGGIGSHLVDFIQTFVVFGAIFSMIYLFVAQPHKVSGSSMVPTFQNNDYILTDKLSYRFSLPKKGDVIVLKNPRNESQDFIKRIIAIPGDSVKIEDGLVFVNGNKLNEVYLPQNTFSQGGSFLAEGEQITAGEGQYIVFGDNRNHSSDSREWGPVKRNEIIGKVVFRYFPANSFGLIPNP